MSFGFSIGDFIAIAQIAHGLRKEYSAAPGQFKNVSEEIRSLSFILQDIDALLPESELNTQQQVTLQQVIRNCRNVLRDVEVVRDKYSDLAPSQGSSHQILKRVWKRLRWEPSDVHELRSRITLSVTLLNAFFEQASGAAVLSVKQGVDRLNRHQDSQEQLAILDWLSSMDYALLQNDIASRRQTGTGRWLLDSAEFVAWVSGEGLALLCWGLPGAGKTTLTSLVIDELSTRYRDDPSVAVLYIYINHRQRDSQNVEHIFESLLRQLVRGRPAVPGSVQSLYSSHKRHGSRPAFNEVSQHVRLVATLYAKIFIVIDALDECPAGGRRARLLEELFKLQADCSANFFCSSRPIPEITHKFGQLSLEIRAKDQDVRTSLDSQMVHLPAFVVRSQNLQEQIKDEVVKAADGIFLLAQLHLESLARKRSAKVLRRALSELRTGSDVHDLMYEDAMKRIEAQGTEVAALANDILSWIVFARRPLTTVELQHALAVEDGALELDESNVTDVEDMIAACCGLVTVDEESRIIRTMHHTAESYLDRTRSRWFPAAEANITRACLTYLSFRPFQSGPCETDDELRERYREAPFFTYAAHNWGTHARSDGKQHTSLIIAFLESGLVVDASSQALFMRELPHHSSGFVESCPRRITGLHLAAYFGLGYVVRLFNAIVDFNIEDSHGRTPLSYAAEAGHDVVIQVLLEQQARPAVKDRDSRTPLHFAALSGHEGTTEILLRAGGVHVNDRDEHGQTPLALAARGGHAGTVGVLISFPGANAQAKDREGLTPLAWAARNGHERVAELLLSVRDMDPNSETEDRWPAVTPYMSGCPIGTLAKGLTPLLWAAEGGYDGIVRRLLETGRVPVDSKDQFSRTALSFASKNGHVPVVERLLGTSGVDADSKAVGIYDAGRTPLSFASENGHEEVVRRLLGTGKVDPDSRATGALYGGRTPISFAVGQGHGAVAELLMRTGRVDINSKSIGQYCRFTAPLLLVGGPRDAFSELKSTEEVVRGRTPLWWAAENRAGVSMMRWALENGAEVEASPEDGRTALSLTAEHGDEAAIRLLLAYGANIDALDENGQKPVDYARKLGNDIVVEMLDVTISPPGSKIGSAMAMRGRFDRDSASLHRQ